MGLDISYYSNAKLLQEGEYDLETDSRLHEENPTRAVDYVRPHDAFPGSCDMKPGFYAAAHEGGFRAGSYSGYNRFREVLCQSVVGVKPSIVWDNPKNFENAPFFWLINFSDCEGSISGKAARKLAKDFAEHREVFMSAPGAVDWADVYDKFAEAFKVAAENNGYVDFH